MQHVHGVRIVFEDSTGADSSCDSSQQLAHSQHGALSLEMTGMAIQPAWLQRDGLTQSVAPGGMTDATACSPNSMTARILTSQDDMLDYIGSKGGGFARVQSPDNSLVQPQPILCLHIGALACAVARFAARESAEHLLFKGHPYVDGNAIASPGILLCAHFASPSGQVGTMHIEIRSIDTIIPYDRNPRANDGAVEAVARSLREFKVRQPIVVDKDGVIVVGHTRWKAAKLLGWTEFPVHVAGDLTPEQAKAYRLADNQTATIADWDDDLLLGELSALQDLGVDLSLLGFDDDELKALLAPPGTDGLTDADDVPEPPKDAVTKPGDLWVLGEHRLFCGDSTNPEDVDRLMDGHKAALVATDPPYLVDYTGERPNDSGKDWTATYKEVEITDADKFFRGVFTNVLRVIAPHAAIYCWHAHKRQRLIAAVWDDLGILDHQQIVWVKPTPVFGRVFWHFRHEPCMMGWVQGSMPVHDSDHEFNSVWEIDWEGKSRIVGNEHPTQKPVEIFARPMRKHTRRGDICFEPFSGSGSQLIAAEKEGRRCFAMELEPVFVDVAVARWEKFAGKKAERHSA